MRKWLILVLLVFTYSFESSAVVDMRNANYADTWTDLLRSSTGYDLKIVRSYNSRTLFSGMFGFGWCSDLETTLEVSAENTIRIKECGAGLDLEYKPAKGTNTKAVEVATVNKIMTEVKKRNKSQNAKYFANIEAEILKDRTLRDEFVRQLNLGGSVNEGIKYFNNGRSNEYIVLKGGTYHRYLPDSTQESYDKDGNLIQMFDKNGNYLKIAYSKKQIQSITDNDGSRLDFSYLPESKFVKTIKGPGGLSATYTFKGENLIAVTNGWKHTYAYDYDGVNNLTKITFPDKTTKELTYNKDKDWVTSFKDRKGCLETYNYTVSKKDLSYYKSEVIKKCGGKITNTSKYEFFHRLKVDGVGRYLYRAKSVINGSKNDVVYHETFGRPIEVLRAGRLTRFKYYNSGLVHKRQEPDRSLIFDYKNTCNKVSHVTTTFYTRDINKKTKKVVKKATKKLKTLFTYDTPKCNLVFAKNSDGQIVKLKYDRKGRIAHIIDQTKKEITIAYDQRFDKPAKITRTGLGSIDVSYKASGEVEKVDSKLGTAVALQVASVFNNLLDILSPATGDLSI